MSQSIKNVDERTRLAGTNRLEVLLFSLGKDPASGREEWFGINVFKVREVMHRPSITRAPDMPEAVEGMVRLRDQTLPVVNLNTYCGVEAADEPRLLIVTVYNQNAQGFLVHAVDSIQRLTWEGVKPPPPMIVKRHGGLVTAVTEIEDKGLVMIMDVEQVLADTADIYDEDDLLFANIPPLERQNATVLFADDSAVARGQVRRTLEHLGLSYIETVNGRQAWERLQAIREECEAKGIPVTDRVQAVLTDIEMPEIDGFVLTRKIKEDERLKAIPVVMHSSLSGEHNEAHGHNVGADAYVAKFRPEKLADALTQVVGCPPGS